MKSKMKRRMLAIVLCMVIALSNSSFIFASSGTEEPAAVAQEGDPQNVQETQTEAAVQDTPAVLSETTPEATPEATPEPTQVPEVTAAPTEAPETTAEPTQAPEVTATPETTPEATPVPTETPAVTAEPTQAPEVTAAPETTPEATPVPTEAPVTYNEAVELRHEFKDENGNVTATVTAQIPAGAFQADVSELTMEVTVPDQATTEHVKKLMEESLPEHYMLGDTVLYDIRFKVNGTETESQQPIVITFENQNGITVRDVKKAVVFQLDPADPAVEGDKDELVTITQRNDIIESLQNSGQSTDNVDDYDLSEITLKEDGTSNKIQMEGRTSTIYGCYAYYEPVQVLTYEDDQVTVTVSAAENGVIPANAELKVVPITEDKETEDQYKDVEKKLQEKAEEEEYEIAGFLAYDITFVDPDGNETEPNGEVKVSIDYKQAAIPESVSEEDAQNAEVTVLHLEEDEKGEVKEVVDMAQTEKVDVLATTEENKVEKAEVRTESFSVYTITWTNNYERRERFIKFNYVDTNGEPIDGKTGEEDFRGDKTIYISEYQDIGDEYEFQYATINSYDNSESVTSISRYDDGIYYNGYNRWYGSGNNTYNVYLVYKKSSTSGGGESGATGDLAHRKYVTDNGDGTYGLTLNVTGAMGTETNPAKVDVVLLVDVSSSMNKTYSGWTSKIIKTKEAVKELTDALDEKSKTVDSKWKVVTFGKTGNVRTQNWVSASRAYDSVNGIQIGNGVGTNYEDGFTEVASVMKGARADAEKIVVFLTDGEPTYYGSNGSGSGSYTTQNIIDRAAEEAATISCNQFYAVGIGLGSVDLYEENSWGYYDKVGTTTGTAILTEIKDSVTSATKKKVYNTADQGTDLTEIFSGIAGEIINYTASDVTIVDTLTPEVDAVGPTPTIMVTKKDETDVTNEEVDAGKITASYDPKTKELKLDFDDNYKLKQDYTYSVTMQIKPNETAKTKYVENNYTYPDIGEADTGDTSAGKKGFYSNVENTAKVTWTTNGEDKEGLYNRPVVQLPKEDTPTPPPTTEKELSREKYVKDNKDGSYDLTLNVSGQVGSLSQKAKVDIVFVLDLSGSMAKKSNNYWSKTNLKKAQDAITTLTTDLESKENVDSQWKLVTFSNRLRPEDSLSDTWVSANDIRTKVNGFRSDYERQFDDWRVETGDCAGGTNYEAALKEAGAQIKTGRSDAEKIVIFLTDGQPTYHGTNEEGGFTTTNKADYDGALLGAEAVSCDQFYAIGMNLPSNVGYNNISGIRLLQDVTDKVNALTKKSQNVDENSDLSGVFGDIAGSITSFLCSDVTITDTLSDWAEAADDNAELKIKVDKKENGTETVVGTNTGTVTTGVTLTLDATETNQAATLSASYNKNTKQLVLDFPTDYQLESNYTYYVTIKIAPTAEAYQEYETKKTYPHKGDETTDAPDNNPATSSGMSGFYSNERATVTYTYNGQVETKDYLKPVIQVKESSEEDNPYIEIEKIFEGIENPESELKDFQIKVYKDSNKSTLIQTLKLSDEDVKKDGNKYVWKLENLDAGTYYLEEEGQNVESTVGNEQVQKYTVTTTVNGTSVEKEAWPVQVTTQCPTFTANGQIQTDDSNQKITFDENDNFIVAKLKADNRYFVWTKDSLSAGERAAIKTFIAGQSNSNFDAISNEDAIVYFYSGIENLQNGITLYGGTVKVNDSRQLSFASGNNQWQQVMFGQYQKSAGYDAEISIENSYEENGINVDLVKCGTDYSVKLNGAKFELYKQKADSQWESVGTYDITDAIELQKLTPGNYKLVEVRAPGGYSLLNEDIIFQIQSQSVQLLNKNMDSLPNNQSDMWKVENVNSTYTIKIKNEALYDLPSAGGSGIFWYLISGTAFMMAASLILYRIKRKEVLGK